MKHFPAILFSTLIFICTISTAADKKPNIVLILSDDFGVGDIQAHYPDNKIATPNLDKLVSQGMSFTDAHSPSAVCSPTRYGLMTGRYAWRTRLQEWVIAVYEPPLIAKDRPTLPGLLQKQGYATSCIGKWHLGWDWVGPQKGRMMEEKNGQRLLQWDFTKAIGGGPTDHGFDYFYGVDLPNMPPFTFIENNHVAIQPSSTYRYDPGEGIVLPKRFVGAPMAQGWRFRAILPELTRRAVHQVRTLAKGEKPFFLFFSMTSPHEPVSPSEQFKGKSGIAPVADYVMETDWSAGQVIRAVDEAGIADNTIVIFTADNGHSHYTGWQDLIKAGHLPSGPYRGHKGDIWEGGHRVPLVVRWPGRIAAASSSDQMVSLTDLFATCADVTKGKLPENGAEDSISFLPAALGKKQGRSTLVNHSNMGEFAYRDGPWKLVFRMREKKLEQSRGKPTRVELYNLETDKAEENNVAAKHPDRVARMTAALQAMVDRGATRELKGRANDTKVDFTTSQMKRWADPAK